MEYEVKARDLSKESRCGRYDGCFPDSLGYSKAMTMRSFLTMMMLMIWVQNAQVSFRPSGLEQYIIAKAASRHRQQTRATNEHNKGIIIYYTSTEHYRLHTS